MAKLLSLEGVGYRDAQGRFAERSDLLATVQREEFRGIGREVRDAMRAEAPKKSGKFSRGIRFRTDVRQKSVTRLTMYVSGEHAFLLPMILKGTRAHQIPLGGSAAQMAKGYPLRFFWKNGPRGAGIYRFWSVQHPGTDPNDFVQRVRDAKAPHVKGTLQRSVVRVVWLK